ncbi:MAG: hypothetical protein GXO39_08865, partial [Thermotogae bacterium]|nr:hypothetical protein [Thermotogota bacterium]
TAERVYAPKSYPTKEIELFGEGEELSGEELYGLVDWLKEFLFKKEEKKEPPQPKEDSKMGLLLTIALFGAVWLLVGGKT